MIERTLTAKLLRDLSWSPAVGIVGSKQVGKTTLAKHLQVLLDKPTLYLDLELEEDSFKLEEAQSYLTGHADKCVIIDEVQVMPRLFPVLRGLIDQKREPARFILLGSASPHIVRQNTETLAGRIAYHELSPFSYSEIKHQFKLEDHWFRGGFPVALLADQPFITRKWLYDFTETFVYRDQVRLGFEIPASLLQNMLSMLAHLNGGMLNIAALSKSLGIAQSTVKKYLELLEGSFLIRRLPPYFENIGKRLVKSPKLYLRDSGWLHHLLRIPDMESLRGNPAIGASWEGYVIEQIIREAPEFSDFFYYRTQNGAEADLVMLTPDGKKIAIEIKFSNTPTISKGFYQSIADIKADASYVITPASERLERSGGVEVCSLRDFLGERLGAGKFV